MISISSSRVVAMGGHPVRLLLACVAVPSGALLLPGARVLSHLHCPPFSLQLSSGAVQGTCTPRATSPICKARGKGEARGFGKKPASSTTTSKGSDAPKAAADSMSSPSPVLSKEASNRGREALEQMRQEAGVDRTAEKAKAQRQLLTEEELAPVDPSAGVMPEVVSQRMLRRVIPFAGLPVFGSFALFGAFYYANTQLDLDLPPSIVAYSTQALLFLAFGGITWGVMSTSWEESEEGSFLGIEQVQKNVGMMRDGLRRGQQAAIDEYAEKDAADDGVLMSRKAQNRAARRNEKK